MKSENHYRSIVTIGICAIVLVGNSQFGMGALKLQRQDPSLNDLPKLRIADHRQQAEAKRFPRFGQCQIKFALTLRKNQTNIAAQPDSLKQRVYDCFDVARSEGVNVLVLPELAFSLPEEIQREIITEAKKLAEQNRMIIIVGSYYDDDRRNRL